MDRPILIWTSPKPGSSPAGSDPIDLRSNRAGLIAADRVRPGFTSHDRIALTCWSQRADTHGYRRTLIEDNPDEAGAYVLVYAPGRDWARWGLSRDGADIVVWNCGTWADHGTYPTMLAALDSLPAAWQPGASNPAVVGTSMAPARMALVNCV